MTKKESDYESDFKVFTIPASRSDLMGFKNFVERLEKEYKSIGIVKVIVPPQYNPHTQVINDCKKLKNVVRKQTNFLKTNDLVGYEVYVQSEEKRFTFAKFRDNALAREFETCLLSTKEIEDTTWEMITSGKNLNLYAIDQDYSLFGDQCEYFNLNKFGPAESNIHSKTVKQLKGIQKPFVYIGDLYTVFAFHVESFNLPAVNYLHSGDRKVWYAIPSSQRKEMEKLANELGNSDNVNCDNFIRHKTLMIPPSTLKKYGIKFSRVEQHKNEIIIIFSGTYHAGFNCGFNIAESINFGSHEWLKMFPQFKTCNCKGDLNSAYEKIRKCLNMFYEREIQLIKNKNPYECNHPGCTVSVKQKKESCQAYAYS